MAKFSRCPEGHVLCIAGADVTRGLRKQEKTASTLRADAADLADLAERAAAADRGELADDLGALAVLVLLRAARAPGHECQDSLPVYIADPGDIEGWLAAHHSTADAAPAAAGAAGTGGDLCR